MSNLCIVQARMGSTRLPGKVLANLGGMPMLAYEFVRVRGAKKVDKIVVASTTNPEDDAIERLCQSLGIDCFRGSEKDVLDRYHQCALRYPEYKNVLRVTGDCPLIDPAIVDAVAHFFEKGDYDYASNVGVPTYPDGMDVEIFSAEVLHDSAHKAALVSEREHVTLHIRNNSEYKKGNLANDADQSPYRLTVDNPEDLEVVRSLVEHCAVDAPLQDYLTFLDSHPQIKAKNMNIERNEGLKKSLKEDYSTKP